VVLVQGLRFELNTVVARIRPATVASAECGYPFWFGHACLTRAIDAGRLSSGAHLRFAANLKCYCRTHHLVKTFWGWRDQQLPDATLILTSPSGQTYVTSPGSALLFPSLCRWTGGIPAPEADPPIDYAAQRTAMMPKRRRTRARNRAQRIATERRQNRDARKARRAECLSYFGPAPPQTDDEPPPF
jgi:hypothetical protein